jgi:uncharacterized protein YecE (DUF72 family)
MGRSNAEKNAAEKKAAAAAAKGGKKKASDQSAQDMIEDTLAEVRGLERAAEAEHAAEAEEDDSQVLVSQTATARKRNLSNSPTKERPITTPRAEATSAALSKSLMEKESLLRKKDEELERLSKQVKRLSRESAAASPASPSTPKTPSNQVQCTLFAPRNGDLWSVSF